MRQALAPSRSAGYRALRYRLHRLRAVLASRQPLERFEFDGRLVYPDIVEVGLPALLQEELGKLAADVGTVQECESDWWRCAGIGRAGRHAKVHCAFTEREFLLTLSAEGTTENLDGWTGALPDVASAISAWVADDSYDFGSMAAQFGFLEEDLLARAYERGEGIEYLWRQMLDDPIEALGPLIAVAAAEPNLRRLRPYTSLDHLHFSRWFPYPFSFDLPYALPHEGRFRVLSPDGDILGEGDAWHAVELLVAALPEPVEVFNRGPVWRVRRADREASDSPRVLVHAIVDATRADQPIMTFSTSEEAAAALRSLLTAQPPLAGTNALRVVELEGFPED